ncbi:MAG: LysR family transcriptional regulator [Pirellulales bacterium]
MHWLNYHHLLYFWTMVREGSITRAADKLFVSQPTVSGQLRELERAVGERLYEKSGRELKLTETGRMVFEYADEIFTTGQELMSRLQGKRGSRAPAYGVGVPDVMPKLLATRLIEPLFQLAEPVRVVCREAELTELLVELAQRRLDVVLSDSEVGSQADVRAFNHLLGECGIEFLASPAHCGRLRAGFPESLANAPLLLPTDGSVLRRTVSQWFQELGIEPNIVAEIEDSAMLKTLAGRGLGIVPVAAAVRADAIEQHGLQVLGAIPQARLRFFAITIERKATHPAVRTLLEAAERNLFVPVSTESPVYP